MPAHGVRGYTLVELLATIVVITLLSAIGFSSFSALIEANHRYNSTQTLESFLNRARHLSVESNQRVIVCVIDANKNCNNDWIGGEIAAFIDSNKNRLQDQDEPLVYQQTWNSMRAHVEWNNWLGDPTITFQPNGSVVSNGTLSLSDAKGYLYSKLIINKAGRPRLERY